MVVRGLSAAGRGEAAHAIATRYLEGLHRVYGANTPHTLWESCAPDVDEPGLKPYRDERVKPDFVGWSGLGPIAMLVESVIGLEVDAPASLVEWTIRRTDEHGVRGLGAGGEGRVDLVCAARGGTGEPAVVAARSTRALTLRIRRGSELREVALGPGREARVVA
jgi:hypothetical protein